MTRLQRRIEGSKTSNSDSIIAASSELTNRGTARYIEQHYSSIPAPVLSKQTMEAAAAAEIVHEVRASAADGQGGVMT